MPGIVERNEIVFCDQPVAGVARNDIDLAAGNGRVHEVRLHLALGAEREAIGLLQCRPFGSREELIVAGDRQGRSMRGQIGDGADAKCLGALLRDHQRIGVLESELAEQGDVLLRKRRLQLRQQLRARLDVRAVKLIGPERAGVIDIEIDVAGFQGLEDHARAETGSCDGGETGGLKPVPHQRRQHILLGKRLGADDIAL
ncbi:hypothetical protein ACVWZW_006100 [Bradyrhizobium sp. F1.13.4]